jgi:hypothetical protein
MESDMQEIWKDIPGFESYQASSHGRIRSKARTSTGRSRSGNAFIRHIEGGPIKPRLSNAGYLRCMIERKTVLVHRIIAATFVENPSSLPCVNHIDGDKNNNSAANLEWCTHQFNTEHAYATQLLVVKSCQESHLAKLTDSQVREIRAHLADRVPQRTIAAMYNMSQRAIAAISTGRSWKKLA